MRVLFWLAILALILCGRLLHNEYFTAAAVPLALVMLWFASPRALRGAVGVVAIGAGLSLIAGGTGLMVDILPALVAALVGWVFARSLLPGRSPLIARAIAAIDGAQQLDDVAVARYAVRLTGVWALFQTALALFGALCVAHAHSLLPGLVLPPPRLFATLLPAAVAILFLAEFTLRPLLMPQAPRHSLLAFLRELARVWPGLIQE